LPSSVGTSPRFAEDLRQLRRNGVNKNIE